MTSPVVIRILKELLDYNHTMPVNYKNALMRELMADEETGKRLRELDGKRKDAHLIGIMTESTGVEIACCSCGFRGDDNAVASHIALTTIVKGIMP